jgi:hypothetical protein
LQNVQWVPEISCGARKLARTPQVIKKKNQFVFCFIFLIDNFKMKESIKKQKKKKEEDKILIKEEEDKKGLGKKKMHADKLNSLLLTLHDVSCVMCVSRCAFIVFDKISKRKVVNM